MVTYPCWPGNSPKCRRAWDPAHLCLDAQGWPLTGDKECFTETSAQVFELGREQRAK